MLEVLRSRHLSLGPRLAEFEEALAARLGVEHVSAVSSGTAGLHLALRAAGVEAGDEVVTTPFSFVASANAVLYERARPVFCDIDRRTLNIDPDGGRGGGQRAHGGHPAGAHLRLPGRHAGARAARGPSAACGSSRTPARRSAPPTATGGRSARAVTWRCSPSTRTSRWRRARAARSSAPTPRRRRGSTASATRAARPTWAGSTTTGSASTTGSRTSPARSGSRSSSGSTSCSPRARASPRPTPSCSPGVEGLDLPCPDAGGDRRSWFVYVVQLPPARRPRRRDRAAARGGDRLEALPARRST